MLGATSISAVCRKWTVSALGHPLIFRRRSLATLGANLVSEIPAMRFLRRGNFVLRSSLVRACNAKLPLSLTKFSNRRAQKCRNQTRLKMRGFMRLAPTLALAGLPYTAHKDRHFVDLRGREDLRRYSAEAGIEYQRWRFGRSLASAEAAPRRRRLSDKTNKLC
jgi:hypothetical protein